MQTPTEQVEANGAAQKGEVVLRQVTLSRARELAKAEEYDTALVLLLQMEQTAAALDLRARIELERGNYEEARSIWKEVLEETPEHPGAKKGLRDVERVRLFKKLVRSFAVGAFVLAAAGLAFVAMRPSDDGPPEKAQVAGPVPAQPAPAVKQPARESAPQLAIATPATPALPQIVLPEGIRVRLEGGAQIYSFDAGLFAEGVGFVPGGREQVTALGRALAPHGDSIQIELVGHVDTMPRPVEKHYNSNTELALARANAVLGRIARTTRIPADVVGLRAVGGRLGPYSAEQGDARNRTVDVRVSLRPSR